MEDLIEEEKVRGREEPVMNEREVKLKRKAAWGKGHMVKEERGGKVKGGLMEVEGTGKARIKEEEE